jgi:hypothetical protein
MKAIRIILCIVLVVGLAQSIVQPAQAQSGLPTSPDFGYGARLDLNGGLIFPALNAASGLGLSWLELDFDWAQTWPSAAEPPNLAMLDQAMGAARQNNVNILLSIKNAPAGAMTAAGADPNLVVAVVTNLCQRYAGTLRAVELFPGANTRQGWGAAPNPSNYAALLQAAQAGLQASCPTTYLVAAGLTPLGVNRAADDLDDLAFLAGLYQAGALPTMPIISIRLADLHGAPMATPEPFDQRSLRHFEDVRDVMLKYNHRDGLIWITTFSWPANYTDQAAQAQWLEEAYALLKAQLFIGVAFFDQLNPPQSNANGHTTPANSLILADTSLHPGLLRLQQLITPDGKTTHQIPLSKKVAEKLWFKGNATP